ncbi:hypothetical protein C1H46_003832 [Malus baccata]|uniref:DNA-directed RNA polymerase N-terminal domain-containing protein n=1 Tax=Malus baccata TaxID=106549 RepID=A0A540NHU2_MALBA|nr:hypothetical protein C1H46_003832 [Malus baccata]
MVEEYKDLERVMRENKLALSLPYVKTLFFGWFEPLREAIAREQQVQHIDLLPLDKMTLIVMHKMMGLVMVGNQDGCVQVVQADVHIGMAIEQEEMKRKSKGCLKKAKAKNKTQWKEKRIKSEIGI